MPFVGDSPVMSSVVDLDDVDFRFFDAPSDASRLDFKVDFGAAAAQCVAAGEERGSRGGDDEGTVQGVGETMGAALRLAPVDVKPAPRTDSASTRVAAAVIALQRRWRSVLEDRELAALTIQNEWHQCMLRSRMRGSHAPAQRMQSSTPEEVVHEAAGDAAGPEWACTTCTALNGPVALACGVCGEVKLCVDDDGGVTESKGEGEAPQCATPVRSRGVDVCSPIGSCTSANDYDTVCSACHAATDASPQSGVAMWHPPQPGSTERGAERAPGVDELTEEEGHIPRPPPKGRIARLMRLAVARLGRRQQPATLAVRPPRSPMVPIHAAMRLPGRSEIMEANVELGLRVGEYLQCEGVTPRTAAAKTDIFFVTDSMLLQMTPPTTQSAGDVLAKLETVRESVDRHLVF